MTQPTIKTMKIMCGDDFNGYLYLLNNKVIMSIQMLNGDYETHEYSSFNQFMDMLPDNFTLVDINEQELHPLN